MIFSNLAVSALALILSDVEAFAPTRYLSRRRQELGWQQTHTAWRNAPRSKSDLHMATSSPPEVNFYKVLGLPRSASGTEIKRAFRKLAKLYHPDLNPDKDTTDQFQALNRAYEVLSDPSMKKNYDMFGDRGIGTSAASDVEVGERINRQGFRRGMDVTDFYENDHDDFFGPRRRRSGRYSSGPVGFDTFREFWDGVPGDHMGPFGPEWDDGSVDDTFFSSWEGDAQARQRHRFNDEEDDFDYDTWFGKTKKGGAQPNAYGPIIGDDIALQYEVDFKTAVLGGEVEITVNRIEECDSCSGTGAKEGSQVSSCTTCGGSGVTIPISKSGPVFSISCPDCKGTGKKIESPCDSCNGSAVRQKTTTVKVDIPAGVMDGNKMRIRGEGDTGPNAGPSGDLFLFLKVKKDSLFRREGSDILADLSISCKDAILGTSMKVPTIDGETTIEIPPGTQSGDVICITECGAPSLIANQRGDHYVSIEVEIPNGEKDADDILVQVLKNANSVSNPISSNDEKDVLTPHNFSVPFPKTQGSETETKPDTSDTADAPVATTNASVPFPKATDPTTNGTSTLIDETTLADLKEKAHKAESEEKEKLKYEELANEREKEIMGQMKLLEELREEAEEQRKQRVHFEELAIKREEELQESLRRQAEMNEEIAIRVRQPRGQTSRVTIKKSTEMARVFDIIARHKGLKPAHLQFVLDGEEILPSDTPLDLNLKPNCVIDVLVPSRGGSIGLCVRLM